MDLIKQFMKIGGAKTPEELLKMYPTEEAFFMKHGGAINKLLAKAQDGLWLQDPNKQALYDAETRYIEANQRGANYNADAAKAYGDILMMDPSATDIRQKVDSLNNVYPYYSSSFQQVPFKGGFGLYGNRHSNSGWEATQQLYDKEKQKPSMFPTDFSEPKWKGSVKKAMGGTPEAYPQIATFDKAFSYGVKPGPQYLSHGGSAYPQAQTEQQFFIPIYTDVYNPYNKAMGGSNVEMYPNAKTTPHWGPSNVWFQDGGQEGMTQEQPELDRLGVQNRTGAFANMLKATAAKSNARTAMNQAGMAKYGKELKLYDGATAGSQTGTPTATTTTPSYLTKDDFSTSFNTAMDEYVKKIQQQQMAQLYGMNNLMAMGNMNNFLPSLYDWNNPNQFMYRETGSPNWKFKTDIAGMGKRKGVSNIGLGEAWGLYSGDPAAREEALKKLNPSRITETPVGLFKRRMRRDYYWDPATQSNGTFKDWGTGTAGQKSTQQSNAPMDLTRQNQPGPVATQSSNPIPFTLQDANTQLQQNSPRAKAIMDNLQNTLTPKPGQGSGSTSNPTTSSSANPDADYIRNSKYPDLDQPFAGTNMTERERLLQQLNSSDPKEVEYAKYRIGVMSDWDAMQSGRTTTTSQPPSNANSMDAATAQKKASMIRATQGQAPSGPPMRTPVGPVAEQSGAGYKEPVNPYASIMAGNAPVTLTAQPDPNAYLTGAPYRTPVGPMVGPEGFAYGGYTGYKFGGSYNQGDVVYMTDDEIAEFVRNGGQIEEME